MPAFYRASITEFLQTSESQLTGQLSIAYAHSGYVEQKASQTRAWVADILRLRATLEPIERRFETVGRWTLLLEFPIPRKEKRIDVVLLAGDLIVILELKSGNIIAESMKQAEEYALLLHYFHAPSNRRKIMSFVVGQKASRQPGRTQHFLPIVEAPAYWIHPVEQITWNRLAEMLGEIAGQPVTRIIDPEAWDHGEYRPVPTIIDAALSLRSGLEIREIAHSRAARHDVDRLTAFVNQCVEQARQTKTFAICFVTGVPGSGKTLVGLNLAFGTRQGHEPIHFMSGTGPLVKVLQAAMAEHHRKRMKVTSQEARIKAKTLIENVHVFAKYYAEENKERAPSNHIIIFDEAQRAWDKKQNLAKFARPYSEPEMLIEIMERHPDWAVIIALVGGGQEINNGEAGLEEWGRTLAHAAKRWTVYASPEAIDGGAAVAGSKLLSLAPDASFDLMVQPQLHLDVSVRSLKAESYSAWVNHVVAGNAVEAAALDAHGQFPIFLTRDLSELRTLLRENTVGAS